MILDTIQNAERYYALHPGFKAAFDWLRGQSGAKLPAGRQEIDGTRLYANVITEGGRGQARAKFEAHRRYIDIQYVVEGFDLMGWRHLDATMKGRGFDAAKDVELFEDRPEWWVPVPAGHFTIFFPEDAHAPMAGDGPMYKLVAKVAV
jgi:YhcH/YjgK/YiaL family protein